MLAYADWIPPNNLFVEEIGDIIRSFGMIFWQRDNILARVIVKARVTNLVDVVSSEKNLVDVPHYLIWSEGDDLESTSWTMQCEIIQERYARWSASRWGYSS